jgi:hypothetical protein
MKNSWQRSKRAFELPGAFFVVKLRLDLNSCTVGAKVFVRDTVEKANLFRAKKLKQVDGVRDRQTTFIVDAIGKSAPLLVQKKHSAKLQNHVLGDN